MDTFEKFLERTTAATLLWLATSAHAFEVGIIGFQFSSETHARVVNAAASAAKAKGWSATVLNSEGSLPKHAEQIDALIAKQVDAIVIAMGKPTEAEAKLKAAHDKGIPIVTVMAGSSPHTLFDIQTNEYKVGAEAALYLLGQMGYKGNIVTSRFDQNVATRIRGKVLDAVLSENQGVKELGKFSMSRTQSWRDDVRAGMQALLLQNQGKINGVWASFDGQAYVIDDLLKAQGVKKGQIPFVSVDGGKETYARIADPNSTLMATVSIPFEDMGRQAIDAIQTVVVEKKSKEVMTKGPYLFREAVLVDKSNVHEYLK